MSLRALTILLVGLVLVPAGILAWFGWRGATAWDEAVQTRIDAELRDAAGALRDLTRREAAQLEAELRSRLDALAAIARDALPDRGLDDGMVHLAHALAAWEKEDPGPWTFQGLLTYEGFPRLYDLRLVDAGGRVLWPRPYDPDAPISDRIGDRLAFDLRRKADRLRFGGGDPQGVRAVWQVVLDKAPSACLRARARAELALLPDANMRRDPRAQLLRLEADLDPTERQCAARPLARLLLLAGEQWEMERDDEFRRRWIAGEIAQAPLTDEERRRASEVLRWPDSKRLPVPAALLAIRRAEPSVRLRAAVASGAHLEVAVGHQAAWDVTARRVMEAPWSSVTGFASPWLSRANSEGESLSPLLRQIDVVGALGVEGRLVFYHAEQSGFDKARALRGHVTLGGVLALLALMVVGTLVVRRAVVRERVASRLRDDFVANVSHELRTPLASVLLHADLLDEEGVDAQRRGRLTDVVRAEGARLGTLVEDLLDFEALSTGKRRLEPEPVDLRLAVRRAAMPYEALAEREGVELRVELPSEELVSIADPHAVGRILANLLSNAWRHGRPSRDGHPGRIRVRLAPASPLEAVVEVEDDGPGIPAEERAAVFERFRRGSKATSVRGVGLGLALSRDLATAMEGHLDLTSDGGRTAFRLRLPLALEEENA